MRLGRRGRDGADLLLDQRRHRGRCASRRRLSVPDSSWRDKWRMRPWVKGPAPDVGQPQTNRCSLGKLRCSYDARNELVNRTTRALRSRRTISVQRASNSKQPQVYLGVLARRTNDSSIRHIKSCLKAKKEKSNK
jgi:hypothetical protein